MLKLHLKISDCWATVEADRFEILKLESQKSDPFSSGSFMAYIVSPSTNCIISIPFCCTSSHISEIIDDNRVPYQVETVYI